MPVDEQFARFFYLPPRVGNVLTKKEDISACPSESKKPDPSHYLYLSKKAFTNAVMDTVMNDGNTYEPDQLLRKKRAADEMWRYFHLPDEQKKARVSQVQQLRETTKEKELKKLKRLRLK